MRIRTIAGLTLAGLAAAAAAAVGGAAYASSEGDNTAVVRNVTEDERVRTVTQDEGAGGSTAQRDCPDQGGAGQQESDVPTTPEQPATSDESL